MFIFFRVTACFLLVGFSGCRNESGATEILCDIGNIRRYCWIIIFRQHSRLTTFLFHSPQSFWNIAQQNGLGCPQGTSAVFWQDPSWTHFKSFLKRHREHGRRFAYSLPPGCRSFFIFLQHHSSSCCSQRLAYFSCDSCCRNSVILWTILYEVISWNQKIGGYHLQPCIFAHFRDHRWTWNNSLISNGAAFLEKSLQVSWNLKPKINSLKSIGKWWNKWKSKLNICS